MEQSLDTQSEEIIHQAFRQCDVDGDGLISMHDLMISGGIEDDEELKQVFDSLKGSGSEDEAFITFQEFAKGILDFPVLLEAFKPEQAKEEELEDEGGVYQEPACGMEQSDLRKYLFAQLQRFIALGGRVLGKQFEAAPEPPLSSRLTETANDLSLYSTFESLKITLELIQTRSKNQQMVDSEQFLSLVQIAEGLVYSLETCFARYDSHINECENDISDKNLAIRQLEKHLSKFEEANQDLASRNQRLRNITMEARVFKEQIVQHNLDLNEKVTELTCQLTKAQDTVRNLKMSLYERQTEIEDLERQVKRLTCLRIIQESLPPQPGTPQASTKKSFNFSTHQSPKHSRKPSQDQDTQLKRLVKDQQSLIQTYHAKIQRQKEVLALKESEYRTELEAKENEYKEEIARLRREGHRLTMRLNEIRIELNSDQQDMANQKNLLEEFQAIGYNSLEETQETEESKGVPGGKLRWLCSLFSYKL